MAKAAERQAAAVRLLARQNGWTDDFGLIHAGIEIAVDRMGQPVAEYTKRLLAAECPDTYELVEDGQASVGEGVEVNSGN